MTTLSTDKQTDSIEFTSREEALDVLVQLIKTARREIVFYGATLDPKLFDSIELIELLSEFCRRNHHTKVSFLVDSTQRENASANRLIQLAQRLTSSMEIRVLLPREQETAFQFLLVDEKAYCYFNNKFRYVGHASLTNSRRARELKQLFTELSKKSVIDPNTRRMHL
jgi:hypothetical protein